MQRQIQKNNGELTYKKVIARKMGCSVSELNKRLKRREENLKKMEDNQDGKE
nr:MAG TPA: RNA polymerase sigma factor [Caudoviricetes sp.]